MQHNGPSAFSVTMQLNTTFTDLAALADFANRLKSIMSGFVPATGGVVQPLPSAIVGETCGESIVPKASPVAAAVEAPKPRAKKDKAEFTPAAPVLPLPEPAKADTAPVAPTQPAAVIEAPAPIVSPPVPPSTPEALKLDAAAVHETVRVLAGAIPASSPPAATIEEVRAVALKVVNKLGPQGASAMMKVVKEVGGASSVPGIPADKCGAVVAALNAMLPEGK